MKIIVVGLGIAGKHYINILSNNLSYEIFVLDNMKIKNSKEYKITTFKEIETYNLKFDYAIICTPSGLHFKHASFFLKRGSNVLIEKPFVLRLDHANKLVMMANKKNLKCWTALQNRYNLATSKLTDEIKKKKIGKINLIDCTMLWHRNEKYYKNGWRGRYSLDGGVLTNQAIHLLDILIYNFGKIKYFDVFGEFNQKKLEAEDLIIINFKHMNGAVSSFKATTRADKNYRSAIDIIGSKGRIIVKGVSLNTFNKFKKQKLFYDKKNSEEFDKNLGAAGGMGFGHKKILREFLSNKKKSSRNLEIDKNIYLLKLIHSVYNNIRYRKNFNAIKNKNSLLGK